MAMAVDNRQHQPFSNMGYDPLRFQSSHFTNPWASTTSSHNAGQIYATSSMPASDASRYTTHGSPSFAPNHLPASQLSTGIHPLDAHSLSQLDLQYEQDGIQSFPSQHFSTAAPTHGLYAAAAPNMHYGSVGYGRYHQDRRPSHPLHHSTSEQKQSFSDALDASRGMLAMSQSDITPRPLYQNHGIASSHRGSDAYGFPAIHSNNSSISSASTYPSYYTGSSVSEASVGGYSSAGESIDHPGHRALQRSTGMPSGSMPPAPQSMMGSFSSKVSSSSQKKHKCKVCDKRFTRPSSLQTHMYSHTGEKRKFSIMRSLMMLRTLN